MEKQNGVHFLVEIGERGELILPAALLYSLGWKPGDTVSIRERRARLLIEEPEEAEFWLGIDAQPWYLAKDSQDNQELIDEEKASINWGMAKQLSEDMFGPSALADHWNMNWEDHQAWQAEQHARFAVHGELFPKREKPRSKDNDNQ